MRNGRIVSSSTTACLIPEWRLQAAGVTQLRRMIDMGAAFLIAGDMAAQKRSLGAIGRAKATGLEPGDPDLRVYLPKGRLGLIEYKAEDGRLSDEQVKRHARLVELGHSVAVVQASTEDEAARATVTAVNGWLREIGAPVADNDNPILAKQVVAFKRKAA